MLHNIKYDLLIVGAGLYGATIANLGKQHGLRCLVLERRPYIGGNIRDEVVNGVNVHLYGAHIFHTSNKDVWRFVQKFATFNDYIHEVLTRNGDQLIHLPLNLSTFYDVYHVSSPQDIITILQEEHAKEYYAFPINLEQKAINLVGRSIYEKVIKGYTEKQWGCHATELPSFLIERLPIRYTFDNRYFDDIYQGIPEQGYTNMVKKMLNGIEVITDVNFCKNRELWIHQAKHIVYTGMIDELSDYIYGCLEYRGLEFRHTTFERNLFQGAAVINEASAEIPYTRTIEHKHFVHDKDSPYTVITKEYPTNWEKGKEAYYPIETDRNLRLYNLYVDYIKHTYPTIKLGGRLGQYKYFDMDDTIKLAMEDFRRNYV